MSDAFHSPRLTLTRAHHHIRDFKTMVTDFINSDPWADIVDKDSNPGQEIYKIKMTRQIPKDLPCVLFDATNNLRAVLDQAGHISAVVGKMPRLKAVKFPFAPTEADWRNNIAGGCKDLPAEIRTLFESFKSYEAGNPTLWAVNEIANAKKHFGLIPFGVGNAIARSQGEIIGSGFFNHISKGRGDAWDSAKNELIIFSVPTGTKLKMSGHFTFNVSIDGVEVLRDKSAIGFLDEASHIVEDILLRTETECRRLGFISRC